MERQRIVTTEETRDSVAELERARAHIETVLSGNADWLALRQATSGASGPAQRALAADPLYRSWTLLNEAIRDRQTKAAQAPEVEPGDVPGANPGGEAAREPHAAPQAAARAEVGSVELHHILQHIRDAAALCGQEPSTARSRDRETPPSAANAMDDTRGDEAAEAAQQGPQDRQREAADEAVDSTPDPEDAGGLAPEPEEATVTFVIREEAPAAGAQGDTERDPAADEAQDGRLSDQWATVGLEDHLHAPTGGQVEEAEVVIVSRHSRHRDRRSRKA
jgi:hypothetical protein